MYLDFDKLQFYNHHSADTCATSSGNNPIALPDPQLPTYSAEIVGSYIVQCGGMKNSVMSKKCYLGDFESSQFSWQEFEMVVGRSLPYLVAVGSKVRSDDNFQVMHV